MCGTPPAVNRWLQAHPCHSSSQDAPPTIPATWKACTPRAHPPVINKSTGPSHSATAHECPPSQPACTQCACPPAVKAEHANTMRQHPAPASPHLHAPAVAAHRQVRAPLAPRHAAHRVGRRQITKLCDLGGAGGPQVDARPQAHGQHVLAGPVHQVEVEIILQGGRVQHLQKRGGGTRFGKLISWRSGASERCCVVLEGGVRPAPAGGRGRSKAR